MQMYQIIIVASLAFILGWREARRVNAVGAAGYFAVIFVTVMSLSDYRYSPDIVNVTVFFSLFVVAALFMRVYDVKKRAHLRAAAES